MDGYIEAAKIDKLVNKIAEKHPQTEENAVEWIRFIRTIQSSLEILKAHAYKLIDRERCRETPSPWR